MLRLAPNDVTPFQAMLPVKFRIPLLLGVILLMIVGAVFYIKEQKKLELETAIEQIKLQNLRIGLGSYGEKKGTGLFGTLVNEGEHTVNIATLLIRFLDDEGQVAQTHQFSPVNRFSWMDPKPLVPKSKRDFALLLDDIVPESWSGSYEAELIKLEFKE